MSKIIDLEREAFLDEVTQNWDKWKPKTTIKDLSQYMQNKAFTTKAMGTLEKLSKDELRSIILHGDKETSSLKSENTLSPSNGLGAEFMDFLDDVKIELHKNNIHPTIKKQMVKQIDRQAERITDKDVFDKLGIVSLVILGIMLVLEMIFPNGFKDTIKKYKEYKEIKTPKAESKD